MKWAMIILDTNRSVDRRITFACPPVSGTDGNEEVGQVGPLKNPPERTAQARAGK